MSFRTCCIADRRSERKHTGSRGTCSCHLGGWKDEVGGKGGYRLAQLAGYAPLLTRGVAPQGMLPPESRAYGSLLERVIQLRHDGMQSRGQNLHHRPGLVRGSSRLLGSFSSCAQVRMDADIQGISPLHLPSSNQPLPTRCCARELTVTFLSKNALSVSESPLIISVRKSVWAV